MAPAPIPESMRQDLWWVRHRIVAVLDPADGGGVVLTVGIGSRTARRIQAMGYEVTSAGAGCILVRSSGVFDSGDD
jgi:hypothetical protein